MKFIVKEDIDDLVNDIASKGEKEENLKNTSKTLKEKYDIKISSIISFFVYLKLNKQKEALITLKTLFNEKKLKKDDDGQNILELLIRKFTNKFNNIDMSKIRENINFEIEDEDELNLLFKYFKNSIIKIKLKPEFIEQKKLIPNNENNNKIEIINKTKIQNIQYFLELLDKYVNNENISFQNFELFDIDKIINGIFKNNIELNIIKENPEKFITLIQITKELGYDINIPHKTLTLIIYNIEELQINIIDYFTEMLKKGMIDNPPKEYITFQLLYENMQYILQNEEEKLKKDPNINKLIEKIKKYDRQNSEFLFVIYNMFMFGTNIPKNKIKELFIKIKKLL